MSDDRCIIVLAGEVYEGGGVGEFLGSVEVGGMGPSWFCGVRCGCEVVKGVIGKCRAGFSW